MEYALVVHGNWQCIMHWVVGLELIHHIAVGNYRDYSTEVKRLIYFDSGGRCYPALGVLSFLAFGLRCGKNVEAKTLSWMATLARLGTPCGVKWNMLETL